MSGCWIGIASLNHVEAAVKGGFAQLGHGKHSAIKQLRKGDWIAYYSPKTEMGKGDTVQAFTSIGQVTSEEAYQAEQTGDFHPWRVDVDYRVSARRAEIQPMLDRLILTKELGSNWGMVMRRSRIKADPADFALIAKTMGIADPT